MTDFVLKKRKNLKKKKNLHAGRDVFCKNVLVTPIFV